jgi:hypothetical protein
MPPSGDVPHGAGGRTRTTADVRPVLYRLPEVLASKRSEYVFLLETVADADLVATLGLVATANVSGFWPPWPDGYTKSLWGRDVVLVPDNYPSHRHRAWSIAADLVFTAASVRILELPVRRKGDGIRNWLWSNGWDKRLAEASTPRTCYLRPKVRGKLKALVQQTETASSRRWRWATRRRWHWASRIGDPSESDKRNDRYEILKQLEALWSFNVFSPPVPGSPEDKMPLRRRLRLMDRLLVMVQDDAIIAEAERLFEAGYAIVPVRAKGPIWLDWQKRGRCQYAPMEALRDKGGDIALILNHSPFIDVECNSPKAETKLQAWFGGKIPKTPTWKSPRGKHRLFQRPSGFPEKAKLKLDRIEFRIGNGKGVWSLIPPSRGRYWLHGLSIHEVEPAALPGQIVERLWTCVAPAQD